MGKHYRHLTIQDRILLNMMLLNRCSKTKIAEILGVHKSTVYREIQRNAIRPRDSVYGLIFYVPSKAQIKYQDRRKRLTRLLSDKMLCGYVENKLFTGWSPWQIEGRLKASNGGICVISHETIYHYIYSNRERRNRFCQKLRRRHFVRRNRQTRLARIPKKLLIDNRPDSINSREEFGHWEGDLMLFKRGIKGNLITLRERKSRYMLAIKNTNKKAKETAINLISSMSHLKPHIRSITFDQGVEFMRYALVGECLDAKIFFCKPASPHQKGSVENGNGVIRVELPRECDIEKWGQTDISGLLKEINDRPLKCLNYQTPAEMFSLLAEGEG